MNSQHNPRERWRTAPELPEEVFSVWHKPERQINPTALVATVDPDGSPRTAPFGSLRAVTPRLLRLISWNGHDTYRNLCRNHCISVALISPPDSAVSVRGKARVVKEQMDTDDQYALIEIDVEEVKNDMVLTVIIESAVTVSVRDEYKEWFQATLGEAEGL